MISDTPVHAAGVWMQPDESCTFHCGAEIHPYWCVCLYNIKEQQIIYWYIIYYHYIVWACVNMYIDAECIEFHLEIHALSNTRQSWFLLSHFCLPGWLLLRHRVDWTYTPWIDKLGWQPLLIVRVHLWFVENTAIYGWIWGWPALRQAYDSPQVFIVFLAINCELRMCNERFNLSLNSVKLKISWMWTYLKFSLCWLCFGCLVES